MPRRQRNLTVVVSLLLVAGFLVTSLTSFFVSRASVRRQIAEGELPLTSDNIYSEIQRDLLRPVFISSLMATDTFVRDWVIQGEVDDTRMTRYLKAIQTQYSTFTSFFVSERTRTYYHAGGILKKVSESEPRDAWYFRVRTMKEPYEINLDPDLANKDAMTIFINYRVFDYQGNYIGATGVGLTVQAVKGLIENYQQRYSRRIFFVDKDGIVRLYGAKFPEGVTNISQMPGLSALSQEVLAQPTGRFTYKSDGKTVHLNTRFISEFGWHLMVEQSEDPALKRILDTLILNLAVCGVVIVVVLVVTNVTLSSYQRTIEKLAITDKLTGVYNRRAFDLLCRDALRDSARNGRDLTMVMLDIDGFKGVNDRFGHAAGDQVLQEVVRALQGSVRTSDLLCRWGGEEFLILLKGCALEHGLNTAEKLRQAVAALATRVEGQEVRVTISLGVAQYRPGDTEDALLKRADLALYRAKAGGRDRVEREEA
jgi:diguanylate cyclase (GGDEF)-like protein